jgi:hypothetical protein
LPSDPPPAVLDALRRLLAPLVHVLIHFGITFTALGPLLKRAYVEAAERHFALPGRPLSDSRVALLTGLHRKDISLLRHAPPDAPVRPRAPALAAQVLSRWIGHPDWRGADGAPLPLPRAPRPGDGGRSFEALVAGISRDIRPRTLLDELLRTGQVREAPDGQLVLVRAADLPQGDLDRLAYYFGRNLADHLATAGANLTGAAPPQLERALAFDGLSASAVRQLTEMAEQQGMAMLLRLNTMAIALAEADPPAPAEAQRFTLGLYVHSVADPIPPPTDAEPPT